MMPGVPPDVNTETTRRKRRRRRPTPPDLLDAIASYRDVAPDASYIEAKTWVQRNGGLRRIRADRAARDAELRRNEAIIAEWNAKHAIGTRVAFRYLLDGPELGETRTRSQAYPSGSREKDPMVQIEARAGGWCITHLRVLEDAP